MNIKEIISKLRAKSATVHLPGSPQVDEWEHMAQTLQQYSDTFERGFTPQHIALATLKALDLEMGNARKYFPHKIGPDGTPVNQNYKALVEEVGELANAFMDHTAWCERGKISKKYGAITFPIEVYAEGVQCAVMAIRCIEEGDRGEAYSLDMFNMSQGDYIATYGPQKPRETYDEKTAPLSDHPDLQMSERDRQRTGPNGRP